MLLFRQCISKYHIVGKYYRSSLRHQDVQCLTIFINCLVVSFSLKSWKIRIRMVWLDVIFLVVLTFLAKALDMVLKKEILMEKSLLILQCSWPMERFWLCQVYLSCAYKCIGYYGYEEASYSPSVTFNAIPQPPLLKLSLLLLHMNLMILQLQVMFGPLPHLPSNLMLKNLMTIKHWTLLSKKCLHLIYTNIENPWKMAAYRPLIRYLWSKVELLDALVFQCCGRI